MKLFWKIFLSVFVSSFLMFALFSYVVLDRQIADAEKHIIEKNRIAGSLVSDEIEKNYLESKWPFESLRKMSEREDFLFWWIVNEDGVIYMADNASFMGTKAYDYFPSLESAGTDEKVSLDAGQNYGIFVRSLQMGTRKWSFWLGFSTTEVSRMARDIIFAGILIFFSAATGLAIVLYFLITYFTRPLHELVEGTKAVASGNLNYRMAVSSGDETGELATAFNKMTADLKKSKIKIEGYTKNLEKRVGERTKELDEKVAQLMETKTAMLNMMEDMEEANKELIGTKEELQKSMKEVKEMDVKKDQFISIAAHELKTPLTSIHGFSQLLQNRKVANNFNNRNKYLKIMDHETKRLAKLVNDILDLSRMDLGTMKFTFEEVDVDDVMKNVLNEMSVLAKERGLRLKSDIGKGLPKISTDMERLVQILINLISNAVKYTERGGIDVSAFKDGQNLHFVVKDTGIGIAKKYYGKLFERFYQIDSSYTRKAGGTGLGLSLCKEFVNALGGEIWFKSRFGKGSEFHFTLPIQAPRHAKAEALKT